MTFHWFHIVSIPFYTWPWFWWFRYSRKTSYEKWNTSEFISSKKSVPCTVPSESNNAYYWYRIWLISPYKMENLCTTLVYRVLGSSAFSLVSRVCIKYYHWERKSEERTRKCNSLQSDRRRKSRICSVKVICFLRRARTGMDVFCRVIPNFC